MPSNKTQNHHGRSEYFAALDGFRGLLALCVAIHHATWFSYLNYRSFINEGFVIIDLFFAFSGFLMFTLYQGRLTDKASCMDFMQRRFARLYPIHLFMLIVFVGFAALRIIAHKIGIAEHEAGEILPFSSGAVDGWDSLLSNLTLTHSMGVHEYLTFNFPSWTISVEFFTYFVFMAMMVWSPPKKPWHFALIGLGVAFIYIGLSRIKPNMDITYDWGFFRCLGGFFTGVIAAWVHGKLKVKRLAASPTNLMLATGLELGIMALSVFFVLYFKDQLQFFVAPVMFGFIIVFAADAGLISRFMSLPVFRYLGKISYSVYMVHVIVAIGFAIIGTRLFPNHLIAGENGSGLWGDLYNIPYLIAVIGVSHLTYHIIELRGGRYLRSLTFGKKTKTTVKT